MADLRPLYQVFLYLQLLDFLTTMVGLRVGLEELSPILRQLMQLDPASGLAVSKVAAVLLGGYCLWTRRHRVIRWINYWYASLVVWNLGLILEWRAAG